MAACAIVSGLSSYNLRADNDTDDTGADGGGVDVITPRPDSSPPLIDAGQRDVDAGDSDASNPLTVPTPGFVACDNTMCKLGLDRCCIDDAGVRCIAKAATTCGATEINCDEAADCVAPNGTCCIQEDNGNEGAWSTYCLSTCTPAANSDGGTAQVCKLSSECPPTQPCILISCGTRVLGTCGGIKPPICL